MKEKRPSLLGLGPTCTCESVPTVAARQDGTTGWLCTTCGTFGATSS